MQDKVKWVRDSPGHCLHRAVGQRPPGTGFLAPKLLVGPVAPERALRRRPRRFLLEAGILHDLAESKSRSQSPLAILPYPTSANTFCDQGFDPSLQPCQNQTPDRPAQELRERSGPTVAETVPGREEYGRKPCGEGWDR